MPQNPQNTIGQNVLKHYNQFIGVITKDFRWLQITTDKGIKLKVETAAKEIDQQLLYFVTIDVINISQQNPSVQYIITLPMTTIIMFGSSALA